MATITSVDATQKAFQASWQDAEASLLKKETGKFLGALAFQEIDYEPLDRSLREVVSLVDLRLNRSEDRQNVNNDYLPLPAPANPTVIPPPGKVVVQPRGSFASRTSLRGHVDLDLDLVFPKNYKITFNDVNGQPNIHLTICQVLGCANPFAVNPGDGHDLNGNLVVTRDGLRLVMLYVWGKLVNPGYVLPNNFTNLPLNIPANYTIPITNNRPPAMTINPTKTLATLTRSISAQITNNPTFPNLDVDFFIKVVTTRFGGEEVLVGVDKDGPLGLRQYQTTNFIPSGKEWVGNKRLLPVERTALLALKWWKNSFATDPTIAPFQVRNVNQLVAGQPNDIKLKSHHFLSVLNALQELPPNDPLYVPTNSSLPFSLVRVMDVMLKVLTFLERAYQPAQRFSIVYTNAWDNNIPQASPKALYPFPQVSCGIFETLHKQITTNNLEYDAIINSKVIPTFAARLSNALDTLAKGKPSFRPDTYAYEEL